MKKARLGMLLISALTGCILLAGCWSSSPIEERNLEAGIALDWISPDENGASSAVGKESNDSKQYIRRTVQFVLPEKGDNSGAASPGKTFYNEQETGNSNMEMTRESYLSNQSPAGFHLKTIVIGSKLLEQVPMNELLDFYLADNDIRLSLLLFTSTGMASDAFKETHSGQTPAFMLKDLFNNRSRSARMVKPVSLAKVIGPLKSGSSFILPNVIVTKQGVKLSGAGIIRGKTREYGGHLSEIDVEGLQWITGDLAGGIVRVAEPGSQRNFTYEIKSAKSEIKANVRGDELSFHVTLTSTGRISESFVRKENKGNNALLAKQADIVEERVIALAQQAVAKMKSLRAEAAGFGKTVRIQHPALWEQLKDDWDREFVAIPVTFSAKVHIEDYGASIMTVD